MRLDELLQDFSPTGAELARLSLEVFRLNGLLLAAGDQLSRDQGLTSARWQVLGAIRIAGEAQTVAQIARNMGLTRQGVQRNVDLLLADGLVTLQENPQHKRARLVALTEAGNGVAVRMRAIHRDWSDHMGAGLDAQELQVAVRVLQRLNERLGDE